MILIPTFQSGSADFTQRIALGDQLVDLRLTWNSRSSQWYMLLTTSDGSAIGNIKVVPEWTLLHQYLGQTSFRGDFLVLKLDRSAEAYLTYDNLGSGWGLFYVTPEEAIEWRTRRGLE